MKPHWILIAMSWTAGLAALGAAVPGEPDEGSPVGSRPADRRFAFTYEVEVAPVRTGAGPLNYFAYPHVEIAGRRLEDLRTRFWYGPIGEGGLSAAASRGPGGG